MASFTGRVLEAMHRNKFEYAIILFAFCYLYIVTSGGYYGDDTSNSTIRGYAINHVMSMFDVIVEHMKGWFFGGRVFPLAWFGFYIFYIFENVYMYKLYLIIMTVLCIYLLGVLYANISEDRNGKRWVMLIATVFIPLFTHYHTAIESYNGLFQSVMILGFLSFIFMLKYLKSNKYYLNILSAICLLLSLATYEVSFLYVPILYSIVYLSVKNIKSTLRITCIHSIIFLLASVVNIYARVTAPKIDYDGIEFGINIVSIIKTFFYQFSATFQPLTYIKFHRVNITNILSNINFFDILLVLFFVILFICLLKEKRESKSKSQLLLIIIVGVVLLFGVSFLYSLSSKMQKELSFGIAYSSISFQYLGLALLITSIGSIMLKRIPVNIRNILIAIFGLICCFIIIVNQQALRIKHFDLANIYQHGREDLKNSSQSGMLKDIHSNDIVVLDYHFNMKHIFATAINKPVKSIYRNDIKHNIDNISIIKPDSPTYIVKTYSNNEFGGVIFGKVEKYVYNPFLNTISDIIVDDVKLYIRKSSNSFISTIFFSKLINGSNNNYQSLSMPFSKLNSLGESYSNSKVRYLIYNIPVRYINFDSINFSSNISISSELHNNYRKQR